MPANGQVVKFNKKGGPVTIEFVVGHAQWGRFKSVLWDPKGHNGKPVGEGVNTDQVPDVWPLPEKPSKLHGSLVSWECAIGPLGTSKGELYSLSVRLAQDGQALPGGVILDSGELGNAKYIYDFVKLEAA
jgi:hypothetical protein